MTSVVRQQHWLRFEWAQAVETLRSGQQLVQQALAG